MGKIALVVGGTGMAGNGVIPTGIRPARNKTPPSARARTADETTFASRTDGDPDAKTRRQGRVVPSRWIVRRSPRALVCRREPRPGETRY